MKEREWIQYPKDIQINTDLGPVFLSIVQGNYVYVDASGNGKFITYKGNKYSMSLRLHTYDGGKTWELSKDQYGHTAGSVSASKYQTYSIHDDMPPSYKAKCIAEIIAKVSAYLAAHPDQLLDAAVADANNSLANEESKLAELEEQVRAQREKVSALSTKLDRAAVARHQYGR